jgi:maleamate amidohydrolase
MPDELDVYKKQGFGNRMGFGKKPALVVIDFINAFADAEQFGGGNIQSAIDHTEELLALARHYEMPVVFTSQTHADDGTEDGLFHNKAPGLSTLVPGSHAVQMVDQLKPRRGERVIHKHYPSGFFGTDLASWLQVRGVDTAIVTGCTTSGCVRATVLDAMCHGFRPIVPKECVGDRAIGPHEANLFDMEQKYADVLSLEDVKTELANIMPDQAPAQ